MSLPNFDGFYRRMSERFMLDRATIVNLTPGEEPAAGYAGAPVASDPREVACYYPASSSMAGDQRTSVPVDFVRYEHAMLVAHDEQVREGDRVPSIRQRNGQTSGPFTVDRVFLRRPHLYVGMVEVR